MVRPSSLIELRMVLAWIAGAGVLDGAARRLRCKCPSSAGGSGGGVHITGYIPVARSHVFTFFLFAATLFCLEELRRGERWPAAALPAITLVGANLHGGFVVGLGAIFIYAVVAVLAKVGWR